MFQGLKIILTLIWLGMGAAIVFGIIMLVKTTKKSKAQTNDMVNTAAFANISNVLFAQGRPSQIMITVNNEIFYGPVNGQFVQVPANLIPPMDHLQRYSLGNAFAQKYGYSTQSCFGPQGQNLGYTQTGVGYLDANTDIFLTGNSATGSWN